VKLTPAGAIIMMLVFAAVSFFCALAETALFSLGKWRARQLAERSERASRTVAVLLEHPQDVLAALALGNTFANGGLMTLGLWMALRGYWPLLPTIAGLGIVILIGCEVIPKTWAVRAAEKWSLRLALPLSLLLHVTGPLRRIAQALVTNTMRLVIPETVKPQMALSDAEYHDLLEMAYQQGTLGHSEKEIILQIISLDRRIAKDVMKPRSQMACIADDLSIEEMIEAARKFRHRRLPIYDETPDTIVGVLRTQALLLDPQMDLADAIELPSFVPETMNLLQLLKSLQRQQRGLAIVLDEYGSAAGLVTVADILEEVIGVIPHERPTERLVFEKLGPGRWRVSGAVRLEDFRREYPELGEVPGVDTLGGLLTAQLEIVPVARQFAVFRGLRLTAQAVDERRVHELLVETVKK
jgi:putative hemolysin